MSAPLTTREALAEALCRWWDDGSGTDDLEDGLFPCRHCVAEADALLASGALTDAGKLADGAIALVCDCGDWDGHDGDCAATRLINYFAAALSAQSERAEVER